MRHDGHRRQLRILPAARPGGRVVETGRLIGLAVSTALVVALLVATPASPAAAAPVRGGQFLRVNVPGAAGGVVLGQLTVDRTRAAGFVTAFACEAGLPRDSGGNISRSDLNFDGRVSSVASNRLVVSADRNGDVCFFTSADAEMIVDVNAMSNGGITPIANRRTDTRPGVAALCGVGSFCG